MPPELFLAPVLGIANLVEKSSEERRRENQINRVKKQLSSMLIDRNEANTILDSVRDSYNTGIVSDLNTTSANDAISGILNPRGYSRLIPERAFAVNQTRERIRQSNNAITEKIANLDLIDIPQAGFADLLAGGAAGYQLGSSISANIAEGGRRDEMLELLKSLQKDG